VLDFLASTIEELEIILEKFSGLSNDNDVEYDFTAVNELTEELIDEVKILNSEILEDIDD